MAKTEQAEKKQRQASVKMPEELWRRMKSLAALRGITLNEAMAEAAQDYTNGRAK